jgi:hypothetical protein
MSDHEEMLEMRGAPNKPKKEVCNSVDVIPYITTQTYTYSGGRPGAVRRPKDADMDWNLVSKDDLEGSM